MTTQQKHVPMVTESDTLDDCRNASARVCAAQPHTAAVQGHDASSDRTGLNKHRRMRLLPADAVRAEKQSLQTREILHIRLQRNRETETQRDDAASHSHWHTDPSAQITHTHSHADGRGSGRAGLRGRGECVCVCGERCSESAHTRRKCSRAETARYCFQLRVFHNQFVVARVMRMVAKKFQSGWGWMLKCF